MQYPKNKTRPSTALTLLEMVIAMAIMATVFAAIVPLFRSIRISWDSKQAAAETLQNGRVLVDHLNRNLAKAVRITAVSDSSETNGYIEFEDNDSNSLRYEIASNYVLFGVVGDLSDLAGPVSKLQFTCYDACDLDTSITDVDSIRFVKAETTLTNPTATGQDKTLIASAYLRTNGNIQEEITRKTPFEFDIIQGQTPSLAQIDDTHYLCAYTGQGSDGWAVVLAVDTTDWTISRGTAFEFDDVQATMPALAKIDESHYLCVYADKFSDGQAVVLTVNTSTWNITKETPFEYDTDNADTPALAKINDTHYLCAYTGDRTDGWAVVLTVDTGTWNITKETPFEFDNVNGEQPALATIDGSHYLCAYTDKSTDGQAVVLTVNTVNWTITKETPFEFDANLCQTPALVKIDDTHYLCAYNGNYRAWAVVLTVNNGNWTVSKGTAYEYATDPDQNPVGENPALAQIDPNNYLCAYPGIDADGWAVVLAVDTGYWSISKETGLEYDTPNGKTPALAQIDPNNYLCAYEGNGSDGWSVVLAVYTNVRP